MTPDIMQKMLKYVQLTSQEQVVVWTALLFAFHLYLRKLNLVPDTQSTFNPEKQLAHCNLCMAVNTILVEITWCKTMQFKQKTLVLPLIRMKNPLICPVYWAWRMIQAVPARPLDPLFCYYRQGKYMIMTYPHLTYWFRHWLDQVGIESKKFTLHSYRRGGATFMYNADIPGAMIKVLGNWASEAYLRYIDLMLSKHVEATCNFAKILMD